MISKLPLLITLFISASLMLFRKSFSYINIGGLYIIEVLMLVAILITLLLILNKKGFLFKNYDFELNSIVLLILIFFVYNIIRAFLSESISVQNLIPGIYPLYIVLIIIFSLNVDFRSLEKSYSFLFWLTVLAPLIPYLIGPISALFFEKLESPGWTYVYAVSAAVSFFCFKNHLARLSFMLLALLGAFLAFERATFLNTFLIMLVLLYYTGRNLAFSKKTMKLVYIGLATFLLVLIVFPLIYQLFFSNIRSRFAVTFDNLIGFFLSIFSSDINLEGARAGETVAGTRNHRLQMWTEAIERVLNYPFGILWGVGFHDNVAQSASFKNVHNGYITIFYRTGVIGLGLFLGFMSRLYFSFGKYIRNSKVQSQYAIACMGLAATVGVLADALTGTIIDSPFTSFIAYTVIGICFVLLLKTSRTAELKGTLSENSINS